MNKEITINVHAENDCIADYHYLRKRVITDKNPIRKRGVSGYSIECYYWHGKKVFTAMINACWFCETIKDFDTLRDASSWIKSKLSPPIT